MKVTQRFPNFVSGFTPETAEVSTAEELYSIPFVKRWKNNPKFYRFSISRSALPEAAHQAILMCELDEGKEFWAIGWLTEHESFDLPIWKKKS